MPRKQRVRNAAKQLPLHLTTHLGAPTRRIRRLGKMWSRINELCKKVEKIPECASKPFLWRQQQTNQRKVLWKHIFNEYHVLMPAHDDLPGAVGDLTLILLESLRVKVAEALPAEIAAATHKRKSDWRYAVANTTKAAFRHCKQNDDANSMGVELENGSISYDTSVVLDCAAKAWGDIFQSCTTGSSPSWPAFVKEYVKEIVDLSKACHLPPLSADDFYEAAQSRKPGATGGADSWRTLETQLFNHNMWELYAQNFTLLEDGKPWPEVLQLLIGALLPKKQNSTNPLDTRVIRLVSALVATYGKVRFRHTISWQMKCFHLACMGHDKDAQQLT
jgi:hypothetical protein